MAMNMNAILRIAAKVEGGTAVEKLGRQLVELGDSAGRTLSPFGSMSGALRGVADAAAAVGLAAVGRDLLNAGLEANAADTRIKALAGGFKEVGPLTDIAARAAKDFALGNVEAKNAITDLYGRLRPMGVPLKDIETVFYGVNNAAKMVGLSSSDTNDVLIQLSQALGSGALQGDELRSIMERMPAVGQAVASVMKVSASEVKKLGSEGKITTDVMIKAAAELAKMKPPPPTPMQQFEKAVKDLRTEIGENLLPILTPFVQALTGFVRTLSSLPEPVQTAVVLLGGLAIAAGPIASIITGIGQALIMIGPLLTQAGVLFAGFQTVVIVAFQGILAWIGGTFIPGLIAFFGAISPVGWVVIAIAGITLLVFTFREQLMGFFKWLWEWGAPIRQFWVDLWGKVQELAVQAFTALMELAYKVWVEPWVSLWNNVLREPVTQLWSWLQDQASKGLTGLQNIWGDIAAWWQARVVSPLKDAWRTLSEFIPNALRIAADAVKGVFNTAINAVKSGFRAVLQAIANQINIVAGLVNRLIASFNRLPGPDIPLIPTLTVPAFAKGGVVTGPTVALIGEGGEPEYVIPEGKAAGFAQNYLGGKRGAAAIPAFAEGGYVKPRMVYKPGVGGRQPEAELVGLPEALSSAFRSEWEKFLAKRDQDQKQQFDSWVSEQQRRFEQYKQSSGVNITTGPVMQFDDKRWVSFDDFNKAVTEVQQKIMREAQELMTDPFVNKWTGI